MKDNYDFSKGLKNPYVDQLMTQVTINLANNVIEYFKEMSENTGIPYQTLINMYLLDCVYNKREINISFK